MTHDSLALFALAIAVLIGLWLVIMGAVEMVRAHRRRRQ